MQLPKTVDYNLWLGPAKDKPILRSKLQYDWHWQWNTGSGEMGNWGVHLLDDVRGNVFLDQVDSPSKIAATGGRYVWNDAGDTPNLQFSLFIANEIPVTMAVCNLPRKRRVPRLPGPSSGYVVYCEGGRYEGQRGMGVAFDKTGKEICRFRGDQGNGHQANFIDAVRFNDPSCLNAPVQMGYASTSWSNLLNIATRIQPTNATGSLPLSITSLARELGEKVVEESMQFFRKVTESHQVGEAPKEPQFAQVLDFDSASGRFVGTRAKAANQFLKREDRKPFVVPVVAST